VFGNFRQTVLRTLLPCALLCIAGSARGQGVNVSAVGAYDHGAAPVAHAVRTMQPITIDGRLDETAWQAASPITELVKVEPDEGGPLSQRTEVRVLYDDANLYVGAWLFDDGPVTTRLARRDASVVDTDFFVVFFDSYHDHRTAYRFTTNPSGLKRDETINVDRGFGPPNPLGITGDVSWDPVWEVETSITSEGWFVEMRIPFGQLRFTGEDVQVWGMQVERRINRTGEHGAWPFTSRRERGGASRFAHLHGIAAIPPASRLELLPYSAVRMELRDVPTNTAVDFGNPFRTGTDRFGSVGVDLKYGITSNLTLDATINPDFGQVEMDPAEINLSAFETRFGERRPFFVEGAEILSFGQGGGINTNLVYSRRIGRPPQGITPGSAVYSDMPGATTILGAVKLTGKSAGGWSVGVLEAVTGRELAAYADASGVQHRLPVEPLSNYFVARLRRDLRQGRTSVGLMGTAVNRRLGTPELRDRLRTAAYAGGVDFSSETQDRMWYVAGEFTPSLILGDAGAIRRAQQASARYFQRPDASHLNYDLDATSLFGYGAKLTAGKQAGVWRGTLVATAISPSFEVNDAGFQTNADRLDVNLGFGRDAPRPNRLLQGYGFRFGPTLTWNYGGELVNALAQINGGWRLHNFYVFSGRLARNFASWDDRLTRGGPLTRSAGSYAANLSMATDQRKSWQLRLSQNLFRTDDGGRRWNAGTGLSLKLSEIYELVLNPSYSRSRTVAQYVTAQRDSMATHTYGARYVFASLEQSTASLQARLNVTFTPRLTLEFYAEPFLSSGNYGALKELVAPRTNEFREYGVDGGTIVRGSDGRFTVDPDGSGPSPSFRVPDLDFNFRSLNANAVLRWEWRPGSTLFLVWQQVRSDRETALGSAANEQVGRFDLGRDARALLDLRSDHVLMLKVNYWLNP
jgi:hypothetical protein